MKIIAIGRNYAAHIAELNNERPAQPVIFLKPDTAIVRNNDATDTIQKYDASYG